MSKLVAVIGQTASGKTAIAMDLARRFNGEIINADSWQIYRGMDIGTAKPSQEERSEVPHHLFDIVDPDDDFTAAVYKRMALDVIDDIHSRGKLPIMVGGTGLYVDSVLFDYSFLPPGSKKLRQQLNDKSIDDLLKLINENGYSLEGIDIRNKRRLIRLIETGGATPRQKELRANTLVLGVSISRTKLRSNIERRVEQMFRRGLKREVRELADRYGWGVESMKGIGYRELKGYFEGSKSNQDVKSQIVRSSLELAKRQRTWFKRNRSIHWIESSDEATELTSNFIET